MRTPITAFARRVIDRVKRRGGRSPPWVDSFGFRTVLDVGANTGQFATEARRFAPEAMIYSFEPLPDCYDALLQRFRGDMRFRAHNLALGDVRGETVFHRSTYSQSSSMLKMAALHTEAFPQTRGGTEVTVKVETLDHLLGSLDLRPPVLLKIDVQGYEDHVIRGATELLHGIDLALIEMSVEPLYEGQALFDAVYRSMVGRGFVYRGNHLQLTHPQDGRVLQVDAYFLHSTR